MPEPTGAATEIAPDGAALAGRAAEWLVERLEESPGRIAVALSGGSTPKALYGRLAIDPLRGRVPWERTHWFFGDERFVPHDHPDSNYRMAREAFLDAAPVPPANIHPVSADGTAEEAAARYAAELQRFYGAEIIAPDRPLFAAVLLGLGEDGHTASLFPGTAALGERTRWAVPNLSQGTDRVRVTLTFPILDSTAAAAFLVSGSGKRAILGEVRDGASDKPAAHMAALLGDRLIWLVDRAAAGP